MVFDPIICVDELTRPPIYLELFLTFSVSDPMDCMSIAFVLFVVHLPLTTPAAIAFLVYNGVGGVVGIPSLLV